MKTMILAAVAALSMTQVVHAATNDGQQIKCTVDTRDGSHLAGESSSLARGVDLTGEQGLDFYAYIDGRTDKRVFRIEAYDSKSGDLVASKTVSYYRSDSAQLALEEGGLTFSCEMKR